MAPVLARRSLSSLPLAILLWFYVCQNVSALLVYDSQALLHLRPSLELILPPNPTSGNHKSSPPPLLSDIPTYLRRSHCILPRRKRFRRRGKRGGALVHLKAYLTASSVNYPRLGCHGPPAARQVRDRWIRPVFPELRTLRGPLAAPPARLTAPGPRGVQHAHLRQLRRTTPSASPERKLCMALLNARSIANKTFLLNDFFTSRELDFMFLTETWVHAGEYTPFSELLPPDCTFFSSPRATGHGGGIASVFRANLQC